MIKIVSPEKGKSSKFDAVYRRILSVAIIVIFFIIGFLFMSLKSLSNQLTAIENTLSNERAISSMIEKQIQSKIDVIKPQLESLKVKIEKQKNILEEVDKFNDRIERLEDFRKSNQTEINKIKKQIEVLLLNNQDFIKAFEAIQDDLDELRKKGVVISYRADSGEQFQD